MNLKTNLIFLIIIGLFLSALISRNSSVLLLAFPFVSYLIAGFFTAPNNVNLVISRKIEKYRAEENEPNSMKVTIINNGSNLPSLFLNDSFLPELTFISGRPNQVISLEKDQSIELEYSFTAKRGYYYWPEIKAIASDPFNLVINEINQTDEVDFIVIPKKVILPKIPLKPRYTLQSPGLNLSNKPGSGVDFWGIRQYTSGDSLGHIHWRLSAQYPNKFFIKQFEQENMADIGILIDASKPYNASEEVISLVNYCVEAGAAISRTLLRSGNRVSLLVVGKNRTRVFPGTGKHQLQRILDTLAGCEPGDLPPHELLKYIPIRLFSSRTTIIVISPLQQNDHSIITKLRAEGYQVMLICPNPLPSMIANNNQLESSLSLRAVRIEREIMLWKIRQIGANVIDWPIEQPLVSLFQMSRQIRL